MAKKFFLLVKEVSTRYEQIVEAESAEEADEMFDDSLLKEVGQAKNWLDPIPCDEEGQPLDEDDNESVDDEDSDGDREQDSRWGQSGEDDDQSE